MIDEEKGLLQFQFEYHELPPYVEFFCSGGLCDAGRKGFSMLDENLSLYFGIENLWSAIDLDKLGPVGIALGSVKRRVNRANRPTRTRRKETRRGAIRNPRIALRFGMSRSEALYGGLQVYVQLKGGKSKERWTVKGLRVDCRMVTEYSTMKPRVPPLGTASRYVISNEGMNEVGNSPHVNY